MNSFRLGPLLLPLTPLLLLLAWWLADLLAGAVARRDAPGADARPGPALLVAALCGLLVARAVFVVRWLAQMHGALAMLDLRDGGFDATAGWLAAGLVLVLWGLRRARLRRALGAGFAAALLVTLAGQALMRALQPAPRPLPVLALRDLQGRRLALDSLRGRPLVINLWATWCPPCRRELPMLLQRAATERDARIVLADQGESPQAVRALLGELGHADAPQVVLDTRRALAAYYDAPGYPTTLFIRPDGNLDRMYVGEMSAATLQQGIARLRAQAR